MHANTLMLLLVLPAATTAAQAQQVYKCSDGSHTTYQSQPCSRSQRTIRRWTTSPDPGPAASTAGLAQTKRDARPSAPRRGSTGRRTAGPRADPAEARCLAAKARREARLEAVGLKRTFDLLRKLDEQVRAACR